MTTVFIIVGHGLAGSILKHSLIQKGIFLIPETGTVYKAGSTYDRDDPYYGISSLAKDYMINKIKRLLNVEVIILDHISGILPGISDRRPFLGMHLNYKMIEIFSGFGLKGMLLLLYFSEKYIQPIVTGMPIDKEAGIIRYFY